MHWKLRLIGRSATLGDTAVRHFEYPVRAIGPNLIWVERLSVLGFYPFVCRADKWHSRAPELYSVWSIDGSGNETVTARCHPKRLREWLHWSHEGWPRRVTQESSNGRVMSWFFSSKTINVSYNQWKFVRDRLYFVIWSGRKIGDYKLLKSVPYVNGLYH